jgi:hypothetical protein
MISIKPILAFVSLLILSNYAFSGNYSCEDLINKINSDIQKYPTEAQQMNLPWRKFAYIQNVLGRTEAHNNPEKNIREYTWHCSSNGEDYLTVTTNHSGALIKVEGKFSGISGAGIFSQDITPVNVPIITTQTSTTVTTNSNVPFVPNAIPAGAENTAPIIAAKPNSPVPAPVPAMTTTTSTTKVTAEVKKPLGKKSYARFAEDDKETSIRDGRDDFQKWFHRNVSERHLESASRTLAEAYYKKLRACAPGHYKYPTINSFYGERTGDNKLQPFLILNYATINGYKNGKCDVQLAQDASPEEGNCQFSKESLNMLADIRLGTSKNSAGNLHVLKKYSKIMATSCSDGTKKMGGNSLN